MTFSTRAVYGVLSVLDMAVNYSGQAMSIRSIAARHGISEGYLEHIFILLRKADIVDSVRGINGGYILKREPDEIFAGNVIEALEGSAAPVVCVDPNNTKFVCDKYNVCVSKKVWYNIMNCINMAAAGINFGQLAQAYRAETERGYMYHI